MVEKEKNFNVFLLLDEFYFMMYIKKNITTPT